MRVRILIALICLLLVLGQAAPAVADQAPFWESPVGLVPGHPDAQVRMAAETVDVEVVERGEEIRALVKASFTMANDGRDVQMKVGFPATTTSMFDQLATPDAEGRRFADAPAMFSPQALRAFQVSVDGQELRSWRQEVPAAAQAGFGADWLMWEMTFTAGQTTQVDVQYEQVLTDRSRDRYVQPMYVLRTGALWHGTIGEATITLRATDGSALIGGPELYMRPDGAGGVSTYPRADQVYGPSDAAQSSSTQIVWRFSEFEPTRDVGATYVRASAWRPYAEAEREILAGGPSNGDLLRQSAAAALDILGGPGECGSEQHQVCFDGPHRVPRGLVDRLAPTAREHAGRAFQLAPRDPGTLLTLGDVEFWFAMPTERHHGELRCWPSNAADAYELADQAGAADALPRLLGLRAAARHVRFFGQERIETCSGQPDGRLDVELVKATVEQGNSAWSNAIRRGGDAERYPDYFAGRWLDERVGEVAELRRNRQDRQATLQQFELGEVTFHHPDADAASVEAAETWQDRTYAEGGAIVRDVSGQLRQRYDLRKIDGLWKIVDAVIVRG
ncbi:MAG TPA: IMS domain-containing protein [Chloroflexota bacterium]|nr:IMS domain-containing protein [Chloroflexota bacterium]